MVTNEFLDDSDEDKKTNNEDLLTMPNHLHVN